MTPRLRNRILVGDVRERLRELPDASVDCVITSPPYFQLRDFGMAGQLGLELTVSDWVEELRLVLGGLVRVLKPTGSLWLNLGDTYSRHHRSGAPPKSLVLAPERLLLALAADGWIVRNKLIWAKTNPMPSSVADRLSITYDVVYLLVRSGRYHFDLDAIRLPHRSYRTDRRAGGAVYPPPGQGAPSWDSGSGNKGLAALHARGQVGHRLGKNPGDVWQIPAANYRDAHFATFPPRLVERPLLAGCPQRVCCRCGCPYKREGHVLRSQLGVSQPRRAPGDVHRFKHHYRVIRTRGALRPGCSCRSASQPGLVLDPFFGAGTVALVAEQHGRDWVGIELNPDFARLANERIANARTDQAKTQASSERRAA